MGRVLLDSGLPAALVNVLNNASSARSLYSFRYVNDERVLYVHIPAYRSDLSCGTFGDTSGATEVWYLEVFVRWAALRDRATLAFRSEATTTVAARSDTSGST